MPCTSLRQVNKVKREGTSSQFFGVHWHVKSYKTKGGVKRVGKWRAMIRINGKLKVLGRFDDEQIAYNTYLEAAEKLYGQPVRTGEVDYSNDKFAKEFRKRTFKELGKETPSQIEQAEQDKVFGTHIYREKEDRAIDDESVALLNKLSMTETKFFDALVLLKLAYRELTLMQKGYPDRLNPNVRNMIGNYVNTTGKEMGDYLNEKLNGKATNTGTV